MKTLTDMINAAYKVGEAGIMVDTAEHPFHRMLLTDVTDLITKESILVAHCRPMASQQQPGTGEEAPWRLAGCVKVDVGASTPEDKDAGQVVGEWGCLCVNEEHQGQGLGSLLVSAAEEHLRTVGGCDTSQLELLTPSNWQHEHKERLRVWYTHKLGYELKEGSGKYAESTETIKEGVCLLGRFLLATDSDFTVYRRRF